MSIYNMAPCHTSFLSEVDGPPYLNIFPLDSFCSDVEEMMVVEELLETIVKVSEDF